MLKENKMLVCTMQNQTGKHLKFDQISSTAAIDISATQIKPPEISELTQGGDSFIVHSATAGQS